MGKAATKLGNLLCTIFSRWGKKATKRKNIFIQSHFTAKHFSVVFEVANSYIGLQISALALAERKAKDKKFEFSGGKRAESSAKVL